MERIEGVKVTDVPSASAFDRRDLAARLVDAVLGQPLWSREDVAWFHADPHAGNLMLASDGRLIILDWALVGALSCEEREHLVRIVLGAFLSDELRICKGVENLCQGRALNGPRLGEVVRHRLARLGLGLAPGVSWLAGLLDAAALECGARFSPGMLLFRKTLLMVEGVATDLAGEGVLDDLVVGSTLWQLAREWPERLLLWPESRAIGTHLSNADLWRAAWAWPMTYGRRLLQSIGP
jgi:predicted unusual protein kinase regulating ubiquinone biosynthesis (AarF/ABC1/UbiB family)